MIAKAEIDAGVAGNGRTSDNGYCMKAFSGGKDAPACSIQAIRKMSKGDLGQRYKN